MRSTIEETGKMTDAPTLAPDDYLTLVRAFPLASIRDGAHLNAAIAMMNRLTTGRALSAGEDMYLQALADLIETYENVHVHIPPLFGTASIVSEVLSGKRPLAFAHVKRLAERFGLPVDAFIDR